MHVCVRREQIIARFILGLGTGTTGTHDKFLIPVEFYAGAIIFTKRII